MSMAKAEGIVTAADWSVARILDPVRTAAIEDAARRFAPRPAKRRCLYCHKVFHSEGYGHRICAPCADIDSRKAIMGRPHAEDLPLGEFDAPERQQGLTY